MFETKSAYYASLYESQREWHSGEHTIWPWTAYLVGALAETYDRFEGRVGAARGTARSSKQDRVRDYVLNHAGARFTIGDVRRAVPGTSDQTIRLVLGELRAAGRIQSRSTGRGGRWVRVGS